jgi:signal transduction histidine kinase
VSTSEHHGAGTDAEAVRRALARERADLRDLAAAAAHDVLNPLTSLIGFADLLEDPELEPEVAAVIRGRVRATAVRAGELVRGLLDVLGAAADDEPPEDVDLGPLLDDLIADLRERHPDVEVAVAVDGAVRMPPAALRRLLGELLDNAVRHSGPGPSRITVTEVERTDAAVALVVGDDGPGVPAADHERVFEVFEHAGRAPDPAGRGVGLTVCRRLARNAGGDVALSPDPAPGGGSAVIVRLPSAAVSSAG